MAEIEFELFNNQLVQQLVGPQDGNLKIIEKALGAEIAAFGNPDTHQRRRRSGTAGQKRG